MVTEVEELNKSIDKVVEIVMDSAISANLTPNPETLAKMFREHNYTGRYKDIIYAALNVDLYKRIKG